MTAKPYSKRRVLLFDVLPNDGNGSLTATAGKVGKRPKGSAPQNLSYGWIVLFANASAGDTLQSVEQLGNADFRRIGDEQMYVVFFSVEFDKIGFKFFAHV